MSSSKDPSQQERASCLVARAVPCALPTNQQRELPEAAVENDASKVEKKSSVVDAAADSLANTFQKMSVSNGKTSNNSSTPSVKKPLRVADPADFVTLQSLKSSALARKTNTTSKFGRDGANLFADLLLNETPDAKKPAATQKPPAEKKPAEKPDADEAEKKSDAKSTTDEKKSDDEVKTQQEKENKEESERKSGDEAPSTKEENELLARGPVRAARANFSFHPYGNGPGAASGGRPPYPGGVEDTFDQACAPFGHQPSVLNNTSSHPHQQQQYEYGGTSQWSSGSRDAVLSNSSTPDTVSSHGYGSASSSSTSPHHQQSTSSAYFNGGGANGAQNCSTVLPNTKDDGELPDALSDFILKYSRSYRGPPSDSGYDENSSVSHSPKSGRPASVDGHSFGSPMSAVSAPESCSPAAPHGGMTGPSTPLSEYRGCNRMGPLRTQLPSGQYTAYLNQQNGGKPVEQHARPAKEVMRRLISTEEMDDAWAWTCKCMQNYPGALCYQDKDRDTLLHIVTMHMDLGKIYALVEQMLKTQYPSHQKPFDMKNRYNETPLFLAVKQRHNEVVDYLLEAGADPNCQNSRAERDSILHYAASKGMPEIVKTICSYNSTNLNATNGMGLTPLLASIKNHALFDEEAGFIVDNTQTIHYLLKFGADPLCTDATNGKNAMHYVVERMVPELIDVFKENLDEDLMTLLVNQPDNNGEAALAQVQQLGNSDESVRFKLCLSLIMCGANNGASSPSGNGSPTPTE